MPVVKDTDISNVMLNGSEVSSLRVGEVLAWEHATEVTIHYTTRQSVSIPSWAVGISVALIGGGGGGQTGNGANGTDGRPGGAAQWSVFYRDLNRQPGDMLSYSVTVGSGGAGGENLDGSPGSDGTKSSLALIRHRGSASTQIATYVSGVGLGGPASGLEPGAYSGSPDAIASPRRAYKPPSTLPRGIRVGREVVGGSPGAGGGYGRGGFFGARWQGGAGGKGMAIVYCYGAP